MTRTNIRTGHRSHAHVPFAIDVLSHAAADAGALQQPRHDRRTTVPRRADPAHVDAELVALHGPDGPP